MKKQRCRVFVVFFMFFAVVNLVFATCSYARHKITIPYSYVGDGWDTVIIISNTSGKELSFVIDVQDGAKDACKNVSTLQPNELFVSSFGSITGWIGGPPPIPGLFNVVIWANDLGQTDPPFGAAVAINNSVWGGYGFQQFISTYADDMIRLCFKIIPL